MGHSPHFGLKRELVLLSRAAAGRLAPREHPRESRAAEGGPALPPRGGPLRREPAARRGSLGHVRPFAPRSRQDRRGRRVRRRGAAERAGADGRRPRPAHLRTAAVPRAERGDGPAAAREGRRALRRRHRRDRDQRRPRDRRGCSRARPDRLRPAAGRRQAVGRGEGRGAALPRGRDECRGPHRFARPRRGAVRGLRRRRVGHARQPAHGPEPARAALVRRRARPRRAADRLALDADPAPGPHGARWHPRPRARAGARDRARRRRRFRREDGRMQRSCWSSGWRASSAGPCAGRRRAARA